MMAMMDEMSLKAAWIKVFFGGGVSCRTMSGDDRRRRGRVKKYKKSSKPS